MNLLIDSHPILWSMYEPERLSARAASLIGDRGNRLFISLGSIIEISHKAAFLKLPLVGPNVRPMLQQLDEYGCTVLPILPAEVLAAAALPLIHGDPFDRLYVAQARSRSLTIVTKDRDIVQYDVPTIW
jgi:PIN domain nuclease of toxin-antitoxin system